MTVCAATVDRIGAAIEGETCGEEDTAKTGGNDVGNRIAMISTNEARRREVRMFSPPLKKRIRNPERLAVAHKRSRTVHRMR